MTNQLAHDDGNLENQSVSLLNNPNEFYYEQCPKCQRSTKTATTEIGYYTSTHRCLECGLVSEVKNIKNKRKR